MIDKIEIINRGIQDEIILFDFINSKIIKMKSNEIIINKNLETNIKELEKIIIDYITYWDNKYNFNIIDGNKVIFNVYFKDKIVSYKFNNKFPNNYHSLIKKLKEYAYE